MMYPKAQNAPIKQQNVPVGPVPVPPQQKIPVGPAPVPPSALKVQHAVEAQPLVETKDRTKKLICIMTFQILFWFISFFCLCTPEAIFKGDDLLYRNAAPYNIHWFGSTLLIGPDVMAVVFACHVIVFLLLLFSISCVARKCNKCAGATNVFAFIIELLCFVAIVATVLISVSQEIVRINCIWSGFFLLLATVLTLTFAILACKSTKKSIPAVPKQQLPNYGQPLQQPVPPVVSFSPQAPNIVAPPPNLPIKGSVEDASKKTISGDSLKTANLNQELQSSAKMKTAKAPETPKSPKGSKRSSAESLTKSPQKEGKNASPPESGKPSSKSLSNSSSTSTIGLSKSQHDISLEKPKSNKASNKKSKKGSKLKSILKKRSSQSLNLSS